MIINYLHKPKSNKISVRMGLLVIAFTLNDAWAGCETEISIPSSTPMAEFSDNADGTVNHLETGLMWSKCAVGQAVSDCSGSPTSFTWQGALQEADVNALAAYTDWRLPNIKELQSIVELQCDSPSINGTIFTNTPAAVFWSSSPYFGSSNSALDVSFITGSSGYTTRGSGRYVRLVRSGP